MSKSVSAYLKTINEAMEGLARNHGVLVKVITPKWLTSKDPETFDNYAALLNVNVESDVVVVSGGKE